VKGLNWLGHWDNGTAYALDDAVEDQGSSYVCTQAHTGNQPPNATYWTVLAERGDTGAQGPAGSTLYGSEFQTVENVSTRSTSSTSWQQAQRITTGNLPVGTYRIDLHTLFRTTNANNVDMRMRMQVNDSTTLWGSDEVRVELADTGTDQKNGLTMSDYYTGSGVLDVDFDYCRGGNSGSAYVYWSRITIYRVA
jgi:hypothetical protein